ncbi:hypothetical protein GCM10010384_38970 [Streptomyces djakartensis]|uniref:SAM-dependent methyltransferase n=1 Tax=Streptomyces djakartensis TaxID=68193 RepID=A0ABQ2ZWQ0_9ACTN|nr:hypothetical protein GCM10010384_38970 [Streptomyces djakartensis]
MLMLAGHVGNGEHVRPTRAYGDHPVSFESYLLPPDRIAELLDRAGLVVMTRVVPKPEEGAKRRTGTFLACKPK